MASRKPQNVDVRVARAALHLTGNRAAARLRAQADAADELLAQPNWFRPRAVVHIEGYAARRRRVAAAIEDGSMLSGWTRENRCWTIFRLPLRFLPRTEAP